jgi:hypothetical protein
MTLLQTAYNTCSLKTQQEIGTLDLSLPAFDAEAIHRKALRQQTHRIEAEDCFGWVQNELFEMVDYALSTLKMQVSRQVSLTDALMTSELDTLKSEFRLTSQLVYSSTRQQGAINMVDSIEQYIVSSLGTVAGIELVSETALKVQLLNELEHRSRESKESIEKKLKIIGAAGELDLIEQCQSGLEQLMYSLRSELSPLI